MDLGLEICMGNGYISHSSALCNAVHQQRDCDKLMPHVWSTMEAKPLSFHGYVT